MSSRKKGRPTTSNRFPVEGAAALMEYARHKPESVLSVSATAEFLDSIASSLQKYGLDIMVEEIVVADREGQGRSSPVKAIVKLNTLTETDFFNGIETKSPPLILALDHITDPRNLGAIVRSAAFYGIDHVVVPEKRQVLLTDASVATSQGGFALTDLVCVVNLGRVLEGLKKIGYWTLGAAMQGEPLEKLAGVYEKQVLVLGSEDKGMSAGIEKKCDRLVAISGAGGRPGSLDSLNVAVAAGILVHGLSR